MLENQLDFIKKDFLNYLHDLGISAKTHKNYKSDLSHFTGFIILKIRSFGSYIESLSDALPFLNQKLAEEYKNYMTENSVPRKTINRRLSTLRHLSKFLLTKGSLDFDFMQGIENTSGGSSQKPAFHTTLASFKAHLESEKVSQNTVKNYVSDVRQFLAWLEKNQNLNHV